MPLSVDRSSDRPVVRLLDGRNSINFSRTSCTLHGKDIPISCWASCYTSSADIFPTRVLRTYRQDVLSSSRILKRRDTCSPTQGKALAYSVNICSCHVHVHHSSEMHLWNKILNPHPYLSRRCMLECFMAFGFAATVGTTAHIQGISHNVHISPRIARIPQNSH